MASETILGDEGANGLSELLLQPGIGGMRAGYRKNCSQQAEVAVQHQSPSASTIRC
jgi:hypothetical protein